MSTGFLWRLTEIKRLCSHRFIQREWREVCGRSTETEEPHGAWESPETTMGAGTHTQTDRHTRTHTHRHRHRHTQTHTDTHAHTQTHTHRHTHTHTHTQTRTRTHTHRHTRTDTHVRTRTHTHTHTQTQAHTQTHTYTHTHTHTHTHAQTHTHTHVRTRTHTHTQTQAHAHTDTHTHTHTHTHADAHTHTHTHTHTDTQTHRHTHCPVTANGFISHSYYHLNEPQTLDVCCMNCCNSFPFCFFSMALHFNFMHIAVGICEHLQWEREKSEDFTRAQILRWLWAVQECRYGGENMSLWLCSFHLRNNVAFITSEWP